MSVPKDADRGAIRATTQRPRLRPRANAGLAYLPASVAPIGLTPGGLPAGVQIIGPQFGDRTCLTLARWLDERYRAFAPPPGF